MGFTVVPFGQGFKDMSPPTKELMKLVLEKKIAHGGHPVLRWMMDNIYIRTDPAGNIKADKEKSTEKIDGAIATIMGLDRAMRSMRGTWFICPSRVSVNLRQNMKPKTKTCAKYRTGLQSRALLLEPQTTSSYRQMVLPTRLLIWPGRMEFKSA